MRSNAWTICPAVRFVLVYIMADTGSRVMQAVTSTLREQSSPVTLESHSMSMNPHHPLSIQMMGGTAHRLAIVNGCLFAVTCGPVPSISMSPHQPVVPMAFSLSPIEDGFEVTDSPTSLSNPVSGPGVLCVATRSLHQMNPIHTTCRLQDGSPGDLQSGTIDRWIWAKGCGSVGDPLSF